MKWRDIQISNFLCLESDILQLELVLKAVAGTGADQKRLRSATLEPGADQKRLRSATRITVEGHFNLCLMSRTAPAVCYPGEAAQHPHPLLVDGRKFNLKGDQIIH